MTALMAWLDERIRESEQTCVKQSGDMITIANEQGKIAAYQRLQVALTMGLVQPDDR